MSGILRDAGDDDDENDAKYENDDENDDSYDGGIRGKSRMNHKELRLSNER